jgi:hypothetical protein
MTLICFAVISIKKSAHISLACSDNATAFSASILTSVLSTRLLICHKKTASWRFFYPHL